MSFLIQILSLKFSSKAFYNCFMRCQFIQTFFDDRNSINECTLIPSKMEKKYLSDRSKNVENASRLKKGSIKLNLYCFLTEIVPTVSYNTMYECKPNVSLKH